MGVYDRQVALAHKMAEKKGAKAILRRDGYEDFPCKVITTMFNSSRMERDLIQWNDRKVLLPSAYIPGITPDPERDKLLYVDGHDEYPAMTPLRVVTVEPLTPGEQQIMFTLQVRK
jgi:hypothetical protein